MNVHELFYEELREKRKEIDQLELSEAERKQWQETLLHVRKQIEELFWTALREGPQKLEPAVYETLEGPMASCLTPVFLMAVDGAKPEQLEEACLQRYFSNDFHGYEGLIYLMYVQGILAIRKKVDPRVCLQYLKAMLPQDVATAYEEQQKAEKAKERKKGWVDPKKLEEFCSGEFTWDKSDPHYGLMKLADTILLQMEDQDMQCWVREVDIGYIIAPLMIMSGAAKKRVLNHFSKRLAAMLLEDVEKLDRDGELRKEYIVENVCQILDPFFELMRTGEISNVEYEEWRTAYERFVL